MFLLLSPFTVSLLFYALSCQNGQNSQNGAAAEKESARVNRSPPVTRLGAEFLERSDIQMVQPARTPGPGGRAWRLIAPAENALVTSIIS